MKYIVDRTYAKKLLEWAYEQNPGPWFEHSINVAQATENIIIELIKNGYNLDADIAYNAALLHDIGRYKGFTKSVIHSYDGYMYMNDLGYTGNAVICVTHSFPCKNEHIDIAAEWSLVPDHMRIQLVEILNEHCNYDLYNKVITLCDALADADGFTTLERRLISVGLRHGTTSHTSLHWKGFYAIKKELEALIGKSIYTILPDVENSIYEDIEY
ncbi:HD domain-containing protein [Bacillus cereus group sp. MYBK245-2]|uniref:HD domain protein n=1 Tax=Bacillus pacificus TaxID=2026187 RepID=A0A1Y6AF12_9BACI|nr:MULTISPECIES: HD domain-containing protein [Bacillus cereus group]KXX91356.1 phosphohydrolase [Bacillus cereus]KXY93187.1 phosphohydrolase [Bacillus cereus]MBL3792592.1 HD domain-containing protein [Bacillus cereus]MBL3855176.1 HD domain-containing protein [Bacillus cereus]MCU5068631.1 HD domain-containing protein [Bacillus pacificus]